MRRLTAIVHGRVHGVGYRLFVVNQAARLGLHGYVRNLPLGRVEVVAEGPFPVLERLLIELRRGPPLARVRDIEVFWGPPAGGLGGFMVRH